MLLCRKFHREIDEAAAWAPCHHAEMRHAPRRRHAPRQATATKAVKEGNDHEESE